MTTVAAGALGAALTQAADDLRLNAPSRAAPSMSGADAAAALEALQAKLPAIIAALKAHPGVITAAEDVLDVLKADGVAWAAPAEDAIEAAPGVLAEAEKPVALDPALARRLVRNQRRRPAVVSGRRRSRRRAGPVSSILSGGRVMADDLMEAAAAVLPHVPGVSGLLVSVAAFFRAGRAIGRAETRFEKQNDAIGKLEARISEAEKTGVDINLAIAKLPNRDEVRATVSDQLQPIRQSLADIREDIRAQGRS